MKSIMKTILLVMEDYGSCASCKKHMSSPIIYFVHNAYMT